MDEAARSVLAEVPGALDVVEQSITVGATGADPHVLDLCRARMLMLMGAPESVSRGSLDDATFAALPSFSTSPAFTPFEKAALAYAEMFVIDVSSMEDSVVDDLKPFLSPEEIYRFSVAIFSIDQENRINAVLTRVKATSEAKEGTR
jgi:hypothetical protein